jgi:hypothetical protein
MSVTATKTFTVREAVNSGNANQVPEALAAIKAGNSLSKIKVTFTGLTSAAAQDITTAAAKAAATISGISLATGENLPPIGSVVTLRVTAGTAAAGARVAVDVGGTALPGDPTTAKAPGTVTVSDDGKTLVFDAAVTAFVLTYYPAPSGGADQAFAQSGP